jgi:hypothetical protein
VLEKTKIRQRRRPSHSTTENSPTLESKAVLPFSYLLPRRLMLGKFVSVTSITVHYRHIMCLKALELSTCPRLYMRWHAGIPQDHNWRQHRRPSRHTRWGTFHLLYHLGGCQALESWRYVPYPIKAANLRKNFDTIVSFVAKKFAAEAAQCLPTLQQPGEITRKREHRSCWPQCAVPNKGSLLRKVLQDTSALQWAGVHPHGSHAMYWTCQYCALGVKVNNWSALCNKPNKYRGF